MKDSEYLAYFVKTIVDQAATEMKTNGKIVSNVEDMKSHIDTLLLKN